MAGFSLLALLDDITSVLDDVALMTKMAAQKTAGVLGDDLALNAQQMTGLAARRELPVVWSVAKGSLCNKALLVPLALIISAFVPGLITPLLMLGGAYLCFEGMEKILERLHGHAAAAGQDAATKDAAQDLGPDFEKKKIRGAIRTDFILSAEIVVIALGVIPAEASLGFKAAVLALVGLGITLGVYGLVALIVKLDDAGLLLLRRFPHSPAAVALGRFLVGAAPRLMRLLSVVGTIAMFLVGGGILMHGLPWLHPLSEAVAALPLAGLLLTLGDLLAGLLCGGLICALMSCLKAGMGLARR